MSGSTLKHEVVSQLTIGRKRSEIFQELSQRFDPKRVAVALARIPNESTKVIQKPSIDRITYLLYLQLLMVTLTCGLILFFPNVVDGFSEDLQDPDVKLFTSIFVVGLLVLSFAVNLTLIRFIKRFSLTALTTALVLTVLGLRSPCKELIEVLIGKIPFTPWNIVDVVAIVLGVALMALATQSIKALFPDRGRWGRPRHDKQTGHYLFTEESP